MKELLTNSVFFGVAVSLTGYEVGLLVRRKWKSPIANPLLIAILFVMLVLLVFHIDYQAYYEGAKYVSYLMTPATVCLAVPLYQQISLLKKEKTAIVAGLLSGVISGLLSILLLARLLGLDHEMYVTLLPKSITTAIGMGISEKMGGIVTITVMAIILTGILGNMIGETIFKLFRIKEPIAKGLALGCSAHAMGTARAMELGEIEGAMSSLSIVVTGLMTVIGASVFAPLL